MKDTIKIGHGQTRMVAHRGCSAIEKENTNAAFIAAGNRSYYGIETDVHRTLDGKFVCIHDDDTARVALDYVPVEQATFDTLRAMLLTDMDGVKGRTDLRIPTLEEYVRLCKKYGKIGVLELKNHFEPKDIQAIVDIIVAQEYLDSIIFISFDLPNLTTLRAMLPEQAIQYLTSHYQDELVALLTREKLDLDIYYEDLNREIVEGLHASGIKVNVWTVDDPKKAEALAGWGVDFITSNVLE